LNTIQNMIDATQLGESTVFKNLTMFPILAGEPVEREYLTLDEALFSGSAKITEVSESGTVPELQFLNEGDKPILLLDGEELVGAKQNRVLNLSILAPAHKAITIPVSCVEQGRWAHNSADFSSEDRVHFSRGRSAKAASVSMSMASSGSRRSDQSKVWRDISDKSERLGVSSETGSMSDMYKNRKRSMKEFVSAFTSTDHQIGAIFCIDGAVAGVDLFDCPETFDKLMSKLLRSYALDAIETSGNDDKSTSETEVQRFLDILTTTDIQEFPAVGLGSDLRIHSQMISGGALIKDDRVIHLGAFPLAEQISGRRPSRQSSMMRASRRRRTH
jgi:hypothetical protein